MHKPTATVLFRHSGSYRREAFCDALRARGFIVSDRAPSPIAPDDILLIWNRSRQNEAIAARFEQAGAKVLVAENGYIPMRTKSFALSLSHHNGAGEWFPPLHPDSLLDRCWLPRFDIPFEPWRTGGSKCVILLQRGIGEPGVKQPPSWPALARKRAVMTGLDIVVRAHPGARHMAEPLIDALRDAAVVMTWGSSAALFALKQGIPVWHGFQKWIGQPASRGLYEDGAFPDWPYLDGREQMFNRLSWAQWTLEEVGSGTAFRHLLDR